MLPFCPAFVGLLPFVGVCPRVFVKMALLSLYAALVLPLFWLLLIIGALLISALSIGAAHAYINRHGEEVVWAMVRDAERPLASGARWRGYRIASQASLAAAVAICAALAIFSVTRGGSSAAAHAGVKSLDGPAPLLAPVLSERAVQPPLAPNRSAPEAERAPLGGAESSAPVHVVAVAALSELPSRCWSVVAAAADAASAQLARLDAWRRVAAAAPLTELRLPAAAAALAVLLWAAAVSRFSRRPLASGPTGGGVRLSPPSTMPMEAGEIVAEINAMCAVYASQSQSPDIVR